MFTNMIKGNYS